jgi:DNA-binding IscR family transcriptional regulator
MSNLLTEGLRIFYLTRTPQATERIMNLVLTTLYNEGKPLTANEIADKNRAPRTLMQGVLSVLAEMKIVNAVRGEDGKTRFVIAE